MLGAALSAVGAIMGGAAGSEGERSRSTTNTSSVVRLRDIESLNRGRSALEAEGDKSTMDFFQSLKSLLQAGPGEADVTAGTQGMRDYASRLQQLLSQGGVDVAAGQQFAQNIFAPQQLGLQQSFQDQQVQANRMAARLGRTGNDPILRNKLAQEQTRQQAMLNSQQGAFAAEQAYALPQQQINYAQALANTRMGLASQAFQNRQNLMQLGQSLTQQERQYRLQAASQTGQTQFGGTVGGGWAGALTGAMGGATAGAKTGMALG